MDKISKPDAIWACHSGQPTTHEERARTGYRLLSDDESLLLIILDDLRRANFRFVRIKPDVAKGTPLAQEVPALIQFDLDVREPLTIGFGEHPLLVQSMFLCDKVLNMIEDRLIFDLILHESLLQRGCDRNGQAVMLRPPETAVNRRSGQHDVPAWEHCSTFYLGPDRRHGRPARRRLCHAIVVGIVMRHAEIRRMEAARMVHYSC